MKSINQAILEISHVEGLSYPFLSQFLGPKIFFAEIHFSQKIGEKTVQHGLNFFVRTQ